MLLEFQKSVRSNGQLKLLSIARATSRSPLNAVLPRIPNSKNGPTRSGNLARDPEPKSHLRIFARTSPSNSITKLDNLLSLTSFTAAGYQSSKHCRISMATLAFWRSNASPWRMRAGSAIRAFRNRSSQPSKAEAQPSALWTKRRLCLEATGLSRTADERQQAGERKRGGLGFDRPPFPAAVVCRGIGPEMVRK